MHIPFTHMLFHDITRVAQGQKSEDRGNNDDEVHACAGPMMCLVGAN